MLEWAEGSVDIFYRGALRFDPMLTTMEKILFLQRVPMFEELSSRNLRVISGITEEESHASRTLLFKEGDSGEAMYIIVDGDVAIEKEVAGSKPITLATLGKRDLLGDMAILDDEPRSASARTLGDVRLLALGAGELRELIRDYPEIAIGLLRFCAKRIREGNKRLEAVAEGPAKRGRAAISVTSGPDAGKNFPLTGDSVRLGRRGGEDIEPPDKISLRDSAKEVSRNHARIYRDGGKYMIRDMRSVNGTFVNGTRIGEPTPLANGDSVRLGSELTFNFEN